MIITTITIILSNDDTGYAYEEKRGWPGLVIALSWRAVRNGTWMMGWAIRYETV
jgi:hypothetical protein